MGEMAWLCLVRHSASDASFRVLSGGGQGTGVERIGPLEWGMACERSTPVVYEVDRRYKAQAKCGYVSAVVKRGGLHLGRRSFTPSSLVYGICSPVREN